MSEWLKLRNSSQPYSDEAFLSFKSPATQEENRLLDRVTSSSTSHYWKAYHIPKAIVRTSTKAIFSSSYMMAKVCFDGTSPVVIALKPPKFRYSFRGESVFSWCNAASAAHLKHSLPSPFFRSITVLLLEIQSGRGRKELLRVSFNLRKLISRNMTRTNKSLLVANAGFWTFVFMWANISSIIISSKSLL